MNARIRSTTAGTLVLASLVTAAFSCAPRGGSETPAPPEPGKITVRDGIRERLAEPDTAWAVADTVAAERTRALVLAFYAGRDDKPAWIHGTKLDDELDVLLDRLGRADEVGLDSTDYDAERLRRMVAAARRQKRARGDAHMRALARLDVQATWSYLRFAGHLAHGRVPVAALDPDWVSADTSAARWTHQLDQALHRHAVAESLAAMEPGHEGYRRLKTALADYRAIAARGGWGYVAPGAPIRTGDRGPRVAALIRRLAATGELRGAVLDTTVDRRVERAIGDFQARHGIPRSGVAGEVTIAQLNVPVGERMRRMALDLERWRWLPDSLGARHVAVNIPAYRLDLVRAGRIERSMRVVVGKKKSPTPVFSDQITYMDLNPTWTVPKSILVDEIWPSFRKKPDFFVANRMRVVPLARAQRDTSIDPTTVPWKKVAEDSFPFMVIQDAGPENPLGRVKLMCPNEYDVYLHDTPARDRFGAAQRDFSHGCVRVLGAEELADSLLSFPAGDTSRVIAMLADSAWRRLRLPKAVPVHVLYWTAWVDDDGKVQFRDDVYGLDRRLEQALARDSVWSFQLNPDVALSPFWLAAREANVKARKEAEAKAAKAAARAKAKAAAEAEKAARVARADED